MRQQPQSPAGEKNTSSSSARLLYENSIDKASSVPVFRERQLFARPLRYVLIGNRIA
jgi:hypothetical protein